MRHRRVPTPSAVLGTSPRPWLLAVLVVALEAVLALAGIHTVALSAVALLAPGLALLPLLPAAVRRVPLAALAAAPALGVAVSCIVLVSAARAGLPLTGVSVRLLVLAVVVGARWSWTAQPSERATPRREVAEAVGLLLVLAGSLVLAWRVMGRTPVPGNDWAKYLLYADEVRRHGSLLIDNPYWMLGVPFREDPGAPALYGSLLSMTGASAGVLARGILVFTVIEILAVFAFARAFWGPAAGVLAAALIAAIPATQDILGWHGLANVAAFGPLALLCAYAAAFGRGELDWRSRVGAAVILVGLAALHRLTMLVGFGAVALVVLGSLRSLGVRPALRECLRIAAWCVPIGALVAWDLYTRQSTFGGTQPYTAYLGTKINLDLAARDISPFLAGGTALALLVAAVRHRTDRALIGPLAILVVSVALGYAWLVEVPNYYARMVYFVPLAAAPLMAAVAVRLRPAALVVAVVVTGLALTSASAYRQAPNVRAFYGFASPASLQGLDAVAETLRPNEVVVTDRCWSFLATWLLHTRTLPALSLQDIQPQAEVEIARRAQAVLAATPSGLRDAQRLGVRYLIVDPTCPDDDGSLLEPPLIGDPVFVSRRLAVLKLPPT